MTLLDPEHEIYETIDCKSIVYLLLFNFDKQVAFGDDLT